MNQNSSVRKLARCGVVAAIYVVLCLALQPLSYGAVQVRVAEALCLLPVFGTEYILGVVLGCFLANLLGSTIVDVIFGTLATLLACLVTYKLRNIRIKGLAVAASLPPVLFNAVILGIEIAVMFPDPTSSAPIWHSSRSMSPRPVPAAGGSPATPLPPWAGTRWPLIRPSACPSVRTTPPRMWTRSSTPSRTA